MSTNGFCSWSVLLAQAAGTQGVWFTSNCVQKQRKILTFCHFFTRSSWHVVGGQFFCFCNIKKMLSVWIHWVWNVKPGLQLSGQISCTGPVQHKVARSPVWMPHAKRPFECPSQISGMRVVSPKCRELDMSGNQWTSCFEKDCRTFTTGKTDVCGNGCCVCVCGGGGQQMKCSWVLGC